MKIPAQPRILAFAFVTFLLNGSILYAQTPTSFDASDPVAGMGVNIHFTDAQPGEWEMLMRGGFRWVRMDLTWAKTEKTPGVYDFSAYDRLFAELDKYHVRGLMILDYGNPLYDKGQPPHTDESRAAFAKWATAAVLHFKNQGVLWEIWNEPNGDWFWSPHVNPEDYAKLALTVSQAIKKAAPDEQIVGPALSGTHLYFLDVLGRAGVFANWSAITIHPYLHGGPESYGSAYDQTRDLIKKYATPGQRIEVICGESGYASTWPGLNETLEAQYLARLYLFDVMSGVPVTIWYDWHDDGTNPANPEHHYGIVHYDYHAGAANVYDPKPAYDAALTYSRALTGYRFKERMTTVSENDFVLSFTKDAVECLVAWTAAPNPHEIKIPAPDGNYIATSYDGKKQVQVTSTGGVINLTLDGGPQYLKLQ